MRQIRGKWALVTGAASGIGRAIALALAREGAHLYLVDIDEVGLARTVEEACLANQWRGKELKWNREELTLGSPATSVPSVLSRRCDVAEPSQVSAVVAEVLARCGGVDILVNNAGITYYGRTEEMSAEHWDRLLRVNLYSHIQFTRELLPSLLARPEAHVLNVCSVLGLVGMPKVTAYCTSKFALVGFSESLRNEFGRQGLGVTALCPGFVSTNLFTNAPLSPKTDKHKLPPRIICTTPDRVAQAAVRAIRRNHRLVVLEPFARLMYIAKRFSPWLLDFLFHLGRRKRIARKTAQLPQAA